MTFWTLLAILFIGLKLAGIIAWSWWLVLLPLYAGIAIWLVFMVVAMTGYSIVALIKSAMKG